MGHEELTVDQVLKGAGRGWEMVRTAMNAVKRLDGSTEDARPLWTDAFQDQVASVLVGTHKIVPKTDEEIAGTERRPLSERIEAIRRIDDQNVLVQLATDITLPELLRREAFRHVEDESFVAGYAKEEEAKFADKADVRVLTMSDEELLFDLAMNARSLPIQWCAAKRLITVAPKKALEVAVLHRRDDGHGIYYLGVRIAVQAHTVGNTILLDWIRGDPRAPQPVVQAAERLLSL